MSDPHIVDSWDDDQYGANWDSGLQWDVNIGPSVGDITPYLDIITSEHNQRPKFMSMVAFVAQAFADNIHNVGGFVDDYDLDFAIGAQLDVLGEWIGVSRVLLVPLDGVYFSLDVAGLGLDEGTMFNPNVNPPNGLVTLSDEAYRTLLRAKILNNQWDGTIPGAYAAWDTLFAGTGTSILIQDYQNMHMLFALVGTTPDAVTLALYRSGYLNFKPATVKIDGYLTPPAGGAPYFGLDINNGVIAGLDVGSF